ncbi:MAG: transposase [Ignavibacteria bacterium]|nr:transposase [Ignavibacteria bacterium]
MHRNAPGLPEFDLGMGIHLVLRPTAASPPIPVSAAEEMEKLIINTALICGCKLKAFFAMTDHLHVLIEAKNEQHISEFIPEVAKITEDKIRDNGPNHSMDHFRWNTNIHITLLPPWHIEILASFVRDQERYHKTRNVDQELREVFQSDTIMES